MKKHPFHTISKKPFFYRATYAPIFFILSCALFFACNNNKKYVIYYGSNSNETEKAICEDLRHDLEQVTGAKVTVTQEPETITGSDYHIVVGTPTSSGQIAGFVKNGQLQVNNKLTGPQGGLIKTIDDGGNKVLVLAGPEVEGMQNVVYDFCRKELGVDPLAYWTSYQPALNSSFNPYAVQGRVLASPKTPIICYFENDVDELANMKKPYLEYDMDTWKGMVNSLRRIGYNAIHLFDMFGRAEFYVRDGYKKIRPNYQSNMPLVDSMMDYAHKKGMMIQVDLGLGYQMKSITDEQSLCWSKYRKAWIDTWVYYLTKTPLRKADIYSLRPRNQIWDRAYASSCGENNVQVFNEVFVALDSVLQVYKPGAPKICVCYDDGMELFNDGFNPPKDFVVAWSDNGYCDFAHLPKSTKGYPFGTYMHAGFWKNHTVHDPYPEKIDSVMSLMMGKYDATDYLLVNGQTFRQFLVNLEAFSQVAWDSEHFDGEQFYIDWCTNYFGEAAAPDAVASMKALHHAQFGRSGYVQFLSEIKKMIAYLQDTLAVGPHGSFKVPYEHTDVPYLGKRLEWANKALQAATAGQSKAKDQAGFYYDYIYLPALMFQQLLDFEHTLSQMTSDKHAYTSTGEKHYLTSAQELAKKAQEQMQAIYDTAMAGDKNPKWATWYDPAKRRPNNGFPTVKMVEGIQHHLEAL